MELLAIAIGLIGIIIALYFGFRKPKGTSELATHVKKIEAKLDRVALYLDGLPETKDKKKKALFEKGISLMAEYKYEEAIDSFRECLSLEKKGSEKSALLLLIGNCFHARNKWDEALGRWEEALEAAQKAQDEEGQVAALGNLGVVHHDKGEWDKAIEFYNKSLKIKEKIGDEHGMAQTKANIGILYKEQGKKDEARRLLEESLRTLERIGDRPSAEIVREHLSAMGRSRSSGEDL